MKKIKAFFLNLLYLLVNCPAIWLIPLLILIHYWIAVSDLPVWFKFWLLK